MCVMCKQTCEAIWKLYCGSSTIPCSSFYPSDRAAYLIDPTKLLWILSTVYSKKTLCSLLLVVTILFSHSMRCRVLRFSF